MLNRTMKKISFLAKIKKLLYYWYCSLSSYWYHIIFNEIYNRYFIKSYTKEINPNSYLPFSIPGLEFFFNYFYHIIGGLSLSFIGKKYYSLLMIY